jgi:hypothetical protein
MSKMVKKCQKRRIYHLQQLVVRPKKQVGQLGLALICGVLSWAHRLFR